MAKLKDWIDISVPIRTGMVTWAGDSEVRIERQLDMERGDDMNVSIVAMGLHTGTHMDAPRHFIRAGKTIDEMPPEATVGPARVIGINDPESVNLDELRRHRIRQGERILFKTRNSERCWSSDRFVEDFVYISAEAAQHLADKQVRCVGIDYLSVGGFHKDLFETHHILMNAGIWIIEGLNLAPVEPGSYEMACLPLKVLGSDGAPARAILRPR